MTLRNVANCLRAGLLLLAAMAACTGCGMLPGKKLALCRSEKEAMLARIEQDQHELQALRADQQRLAEAEKQLARMYERQADERLAALPEAPSSLYTPPAEASDADESP